MDMMIPFLGRISRLQVESKGAFYIAGLKETNTHRVELDKRRQNTLAQQLPEKSTKHPEPSDGVSTDEKGIDHLDTWA